MTTVQDYYNGYNSDYVSGNTFTINGTLYVLVALPGNAYVLLNTVTYAPTVRKFMQSPIRYDEIKELAAPLMPDASGIIPTGAQSNRKLPTGTKIISKLPDQNLPNLQLVSIWDAAALSGIYYFIDVVSGLVYSKINALAHYDGINALRFSNMGIGLASDWEIV